MLLLIFHFESGLRSFQKEEFKETVKVKLILITADLHFSDLITEFDNEKFTFTELFEIVFSASDPWSSVLTRVYNINERSSKKCLYLLKRLSHRGLYADC